MLRQLINVCFGILIFPGAAAGFLWRYTRDSFTLGNDLAVEFAAWRDREERAHAHRRIERVSRIPGRFYAR